MASKFLIKHVSDKKFHFTLISKNGQVILSSEVYNSKQAAKKGIESCRVNSQLEKAYKVLTAKNGEKYFNLCAANGEVIGTSETYKASAGLNNGIKSVRENAPDAPIEEVPS